MNVRNALFCLWNHITLTKHPSLPALCMFKHSIKNGIYSFYRKNILAYLLFGGHRPVSSQRSNFQLNVQQGSSLLSDEYDKDRKHTSDKSY
ncbi:MAG: hypothetical protein ACK5CH_15680, partial [Bacteroidota bacterium]